MQNDLEPIIENINEKKLIGMSQKMSLSENTTFKLFSSFMPRRKEIMHSINSETYDLKIYPDNYFLNFNPSTYFTKWALIEVSDVSNVPNDMEIFTLNEGKYAVFKHKGLSKDNSTFQYIFTNWLPKSDYILDDRPHFEILGEKTKRNDPNSEEEIWIPIKLNE